MMPTNTGRRVMGVASEKIALPLSRNLGYGSSGDSVLVFMVCAVIVVPWTLAKGAGVLNTAS